MIFIHGTEGGVLYEAVTSNSSTDMMCVESVIQMMGWKNVIFIMDKLSQSYWGEKHVFICKGRFNKLWLIG